MSGVGDVVSVVERCYELESDTETWLSGLMDAALPILDRGHGAAAFLFDATRERLAPPVIVGRGIQGARLAGVVELLVNAPRAMVQRTFLSPRIVATTSEATGLGAELASYEAWTRFAKPLGIADALGIKATGARPGQGCMLQAVLDRIGTTTAAERRLWERIAAHVSAGLRLRWSLESEAEGARGRTEAVLTPNGKVEHAEAAARAISRREVLREAVRRLEKARGPTRRKDPDAALDLWKGLVGGRWTLVDHYERGGRRYVVARRNDPEHGDPRALSGRERQVVHLVAQGQSNKLIAYSLGLSLSTVATHIASARSKLGVSSRTELIALVTGLGGGR